MASPGIRFTPEQRQEILHCNWQEWVLKPWRNDFLGKRPHYCCEECRFVHWDDGQYFDIDHVVPFSQGGTNEALNARVLCQGCNRARQNRQFVIPTTGYAYTKHDIDCNPVHKHHGAPKVSQHEIATHPEPFWPKRR